MTDIEAMKKGYEYIRDRKGMYNRDVLNCIEYINNCMGYINCLYDLKLITSSEKYALYDFMIGE